MRRLVYHSVLHPQIEAMPHHWEKMRAEELLFAAGLDVTVLQPTAYMQNILAGWRDIVEAGIYRVPYPVESRISLVDLDDVAAAAALVLTQPGHVRRDLRTRRHVAVEPDRGCGCAERGARQTRPGDGRAGRSVGGPRSRRRLG